MSERSTSHDVSVLLGHGAWLRRLAGHLVSGSDGAEDAVQETWLAALRAPPSPGDDLKPWLARVLRNALTRRARTDSRRRARERAVTEAAPVAGESLAASLEQLELQRQLTKLVTELEEPYRATIVMRYFEGKSAAEIARSQDIPPGTVRWRTKEALDRLRRRLDEAEGGDRKAWSVALAPLASGAGGRRPAAAGRPKGGWPAAPVTVGAAAVLGLVAVVAVLVLASAPKREDADGGARSGWRLPRFAALFAGGAAAPAAAHDVDGVVFGPDGQPVAGAVVTARAPRSRTPGGMSYGTERPIPEALAVSDGKGEFRLTRLSAGSYVVGAAHHQHAAAYVREVVVPQQGRMELRLGLGGFSLSGVVQDQGGGPIPGARVMVQGRLLATFAALSSASGGYRLVLSERASTVVVTADGYGPQRLSVGVNADERRDFRLAPAARVAGRVIAQGRPVSGAEVRLLPVAIGPRDWWEERAITDQHGDFVLANLPAVDFRLLVRHGGLVTPTRALVSLRAGGEEKVQLVLEPGVVLRGRIRDGSGRPVPRAGVGVIERRDGALDRAAIGTLAESYADGQGNFQIEGLPPGALEVRPAASGYTSHSRQVDLGPQPVVSADLLLEPASGVVGLVRRADGSPAANVEVRGSSRSEVGGARAGSSARPDAAGRFEMPGLGAGQVSLTAWSDREVAVHGPFALRAGERREVEVTLAPGAFVSGRVRWDDGRPAAGVRVWAVNEKAVPSPGESLNHDIMIEAVRTDPEGRFTVGPFLPGRARLAAHGPGDRHSISSAPRPNQAVAAVGPGQQVTGVELLLSSGRGRLAGTTVDPTGAALPGATIIAVQELPEQTPLMNSTDARQAISGGDGAFAVEGLAQGTFTIFGRHPEHPDLVITGVQGGASDLRVRFAAAAQLAGTVTSRRGVPVKDYFLVIAPAASPEPTRRAGPDLPRLEVTDPRGAFVASRLAPGQYDLTAMTADGLVAQATGVTLAEGERRRVPMVAQPGATLVGRVVHEGTGAPAAGVRVATRLPGMRSSETLTDGSGAFRLRGVLPGERVRLRAGRERPPETGTLEVTVPRLGVTVDAGTIPLRPFSAAAPAQGR
jgi:RNA polymerase sigma factor (sigma-70 family)